MKINTVYPKLLINNDEIENLSVEKKKNRNGTEYEKLIKFAAHNKLSLAPISQAHTHVCLISKEIISHFNFISKISVSFIVK